MENFHFIGCDFSIGTHKVAGTANALFCSKTSGKLLVLDWKTSDPDKIHQCFGHCQKVHLLGLPLSKYYQHTAQVMGYAEMLHHKVNSGKKAHCIEVASPMAITN